MGSYELTEWAALCAIEPWGDMREDLRSAMECHASVMPYSKKAKPADFLLPDVRVKSEDRKILPPATFMAILNASC